MTVTTEYLELARGQITELRAKGADFHADALAKWVAENEAGAVEASPVPVRTATLAFGPTYSAELAALLGQGACAISNRIYGIGDSETVYQLPSGEVARVKRGAAYAKVTVWNCIQGWWQADQAAALEERDPETGRTLASYQPAR